MYIQFDYIFSKVWLYVQPTTTLVYRHEIDNSQLLFWDKYHVNIMQFNVSLAY